MFTSFYAPPAQLPQYSYYRRTEEQPTVSHSAGVFVFGFLAGVGVTVLTGVLVALWMLNRASAAD